MNFLKLFLRAVALLPTVVQGVETLYGAEPGARKRQAAVSILRASMGVAEAVESTAIADPAKFSEALGAIVDGVVACLNASIWAGRRGVERGG